MVKFFIYFNFAPLILQRSGPFHGTEENKIVKANSKIIKKKSCVKKFSIE